jgi:hypothetical protein
MRDLGTPLTVDISPVEANANSRRLDQKPSRTWLFWDLNIFRIIFKKNIYF